jgi:hypothetical protein
VRVVLLLCVVRLGLAVDEDTGRLAARLEHLRKPGLLASAEFSETTFRGIQTEYVAWIDARVLAGLGIAEMNEELRAAKLLDPSGLENPFTQSYAGFLEPVETLAPQLAPDLLALRAGIHTGPSCSVDQTLLLYQRNPLRRLGILNGEVSFSHGYILGEARFGRSSVDRRLVATAWIGSNCTSVWNGMRLRLDEASETSIRNVLNRPLAAKNDEFELKVEENIATFSYGTLMLDDQIQGRRGIARYRVQNGRAVREAPFAVQRSGLVDEWVKLATEAVRPWSGMGAVRMHSSVVAGMEGKSFAWQTVASCPGTAKTIEIGVRTESDNRFVFRLSGTTATNLRMVSVTDTPSTTCIPMESEAAFATLFRVLPW